MVAEQVGKRVAGGVERGVCAIDIAGGGELYEMEKAENETRVHHVNIGAVPEGLFHAIGQVSECIPGALGRDPQHGSDTRVDHGHIKVLCFDAAEDPQFRCIRLPSDALESVFEIRLVLCPVRRLWVHPLR